jgi:hypothetical protein
MRFWRNNRLDAEFELDPAHAVGLSQQVALLVVERASTTP